MKPPLLTTGLVLIASLMGCASKAETKQENECERAIKHALDIEEKHTIAHDRVLRDNASLRQQLFEVRRETFASVATQRCSESESYARCLLQAQDRDSLAECQ